MALQLNLSPEPTGLVFPEAYCRIVSIERNRDIRCATISCCFYKDAQARADRKEPLNTSFSTRFVISGDVYDAFYPTTDEPIPSEEIRSYEALKSLPFFANAIDC